MLKKQFLLFSLICMLFNIAVAQNRSINFDHGTFSEILARAKKENKMIYIDCYTTWCGPCKWMAKNVFTNDTVADFYNKNFINAKIDMENGEGIEIAKRYDIRAYPIMLYLDADGKQLHRTCGSTPAKNFIVNGENALAPETQLATYNANFKDGKVNSTFATTYFSMLENACQSLDKEVSAYFASVNPSELQSRQNWNIINMYVEDYSSPTFKAFEKDKATFVSLYGADSVENKIIKVYTSGLYSALQNKNMADYGSIQTWLRASGAKNADKVIMQADIRLYMMNKDWAKYAVTTSDYVAKYSMENAGELNSFAWSFFENIDDKAQLEKAIQWSKKSIELEDNYPYNDTYASLLYKVGNKAAAETAANKAIALAKKSGDDFKETQALLEKIKLLK